MKTSRFESFRARRWFPIFALILSSFLPASPAHAKTILNVDLGGSFKSIASYQRLRQTGIYAKDSVPEIEERLRLQAVLSNSWLHIEAANETSFFWHQHNPAAFPVPNVNPVSAWNAQWDIHRTNETVLYNRMDRLFVQVTQEALTVSVGKQVIATGVGQIFNAISQIQRYPYIFIDTEYEKTEDAASLVWAGPLQLEARFLPKTADQAKHNFHLRAKGTKGGFDTAMTAGRSDEKVYVGLEAAGNLGSSVIRGEVVGYEELGHNTIQGLVGWDYVFSPKWSAKAEVFYNGFGEPTNYAVAAFPHRSTPLRGVWYGGALVTWETHPLFKSNLLAIVNLHDPSTLLHLYFNYSLGNNLDLLFGQFLNVGGDTAEFGGKLPVLPGIQLGQPDVTYATLRWYF